MTPNVEEAGDQMGNQDGDGPGFLWEGDDLIRSRCTRDTIPSSYKLKIRRAFAIAMVGVQRQPDVVAIGSQSAVLNPRRVDGRRQKRHGLQMGREKPIQLYRCRLQLGVLESLFRLEILSSTLSHEQSGLSTVVDSLDVLGRGMQ